MTNFPSFPFEFRSTVLQISQLLTFAPSKEKHHTKTTNFLNLPLELRQAILFQAFKQAAFEDIRFSNLQSKLLAHANHIAAIHKSYPTIFTAICTPNIHKLAATLTAVHPQLKTEMIYPLGLVLPDFENLEEVEPERHCLELRFDSLYDPDTYEPMRNEMWSQKRTSHG